MFFEVFRAVLFGTALTTLILECGHFWMDAEMYEISQRSLSLIELITILFLGLTLLTARAGLLFPSLLFVPIPLVLWEHIKKSDRKRDERTRRKREEADVERLTEVIEKAKEPALVYKALVDLGDLYTKRQEYDNSIELYKRAEEIGENNNLGGLPGIPFRIKRAEKENSIKKSERWVCTECGYDNPSSIDTCRMCGNKRDRRKSARRDIQMHKKDIKTDAANIIFIAVAIVAGLNLLHFLLKLMVFLYNHMSWQIAVPLIIVIATLAIFFFLKLIAFVKCTVIPKLLK